MNIRLNFIRYEHNLPGANAEFGHLLQFIQNKIDGTHFEEKKYKKKNDKDILFTNTNNSNELSDDKIKHITKAVKIELLQTIHILADGAFLTPFRDKMVGLFQKINLQANQEYVKRTFTTPMLKDGMTLGMNRFISEEYFGEVFSCLKDVEYQGASKDFINLMVNSSFKSDKAFFMWSNVIIFGSFSSLIVGWI